VLTMLEDSSFEARTRRMLKERPRSLEYTHIADATRLKYRWIVSFAANDKEDYGVRKIHRLHEYLISLYVAHVA
jgi:hypothetical protein